MAYAYSADVWCDSCGGELCRELPVPHYPPPYDTDDYPSYYDADSDVADYPQHCAAGEECLEAIELPSGRKIGALLGTQLTEYGVQWLRDTLDNEAGDSEVLELWRSEFAHYVQADD